MILEELEKQCNGFRDSKQFSLADIEKILGEMKCEKCLYYVGCSKSVLRSTYKNEVRKTTVLIFCSQFEAKE